MVLLFYKLCCRFFYRFFYRKITAEHYWNCYDKKDSKKGEKKYFRLLKILSVVTTSKDLFENDQRRKDFIDKIINNFINNYAQQSHAKIIIILGSIASGKTSFKDKIVDDSEVKNYLYINFDEIKKKLPEYKYLKDLNPKRAANFVQSESAKISGKLLKKSIKKTINIIYEQNLHYSEKEKIKILENIKQSKKKKYFIRLHILFIGSVQMSFDRANERYKKNKRFVKKKKIEGSFFSLWNNLPRFIKSLSDDSISTNLYFWNNAVDNNPVSFFAICMIVDKENYGILPKIQSALKATNVGNIILNKINNKIIFFTYEEGFTLLPQNILKKYIKSLDKLKKDIESADNLKSLDKGLKSMVDTSSREK
ncbi:MAG: hypothetical protein HAW60_04015 [Bdellovibrionales bacterium]|nr:hypothetical protein [Bdellovibrionales bacterium]